MSSEVDIINAAYARIGGAFIQDVTESQKASLGYLLYQRIRNRYQAGFPWHFCQAVSTLNEVSPQDDTVSSYLGIQYVIPSDCAAVMELLPRENGSKWDIIGNLFITNVESPVIIYRTLVTTTGLFPEWFTEAVIARLAMELVPREIGTKEALRTNLRNEALVAWGEATEIDANIGYSVRDAEDEYDRSSFVMPSDIADDDVYARYST